MLIFPGHGFPDVVGALGTIVSVMFFLVCLAVLIGLIFLFVRFLLVVTHAAQLYIAKNEPTRPVAPTAPAAPVAEPATVKPATTTATKPATTRRAPKTPPPTV